MAAITYAFDNYSIYQFSVEYTAGQTAFITCSEGTTNRATLYFYRTGVTIPPSKMNTNGTILLRFPEARFSEIIATLREEKPLSVTFSDILGSGWISTSAEPIGDEEGV
jgi:hypothetical protein